MQSLESLFDIFSTNLAFYEKKYKEQFMCPLCKHIFSRDQIYSDLSKAHIIPQFLNGHDWTLTCKECNNKVGSNIEGCEAKRANFNWALAGDGEEKTPVDVWLRDEHGDLLGPVKADMCGKKNDCEHRLQLYTKQKGSNAKAWELFNSNPEQSIEVRYFETPNAKRAKLTYVHAAYLFMFHQFGYEWVLNRCSEPIRKQLVSPDESILSPLAPELSDHGIPDDKMAILLVTKPENWVSFLVVLPLIRGWSKRQAVWMPLFDRQYSQPPQDKINLQTVPIPEFHNSLNLNKHDSMYQGYRFIQKYIDK